MIIMPEKQKILVVDDNQFVADLVSAGLEGDGYEVEAFTDPQKALDKLPDGYDGLFTDFLMGTMNGVQFLRAAREKGYDGPAFLMTGTPEELTEYLSNNRLEEAFARYCDGVMQKPIPNMCEPGRLLREYKPREHKPQ